MNDCPSLNLFGSDIILLSQSPSQWWAALLLFQKLFIRGQSIVHVCICPLFSHGKKMVIIMNPLCNVGTSGSWAQSKGTMEGFRLKEIEKEHTILWIVLLLISMVCSKGQKRADSLEALWKRLSCKLATCHAKVHRWHFSQPPRLPTLTSPRYPPDTLSTLGTYPPDTSRGSARVLACDYPESRATRRHCGSPGRASLCLRRSTKAETIVAFLGSGGCGCLMRCTETWLSLWHLRFRLLTRRRRANFAAGFEVLGPESFLSIAGEESVR